MGEGLRVSDRTANICKGHALIIFEGLVELMHAVSIVSCFIVKGCRRGNRAEDRSSR